MALNTVVLCPGQGAQALGMGKAWHDHAPEAKAVFDLADKILGSRLGESLSRLCFDGPVERLNQTDVSQPAIFVTSVASWHALQSRRGMGAGDEPLGAAAGLSLGEYTALHIAGTVSFEDGLELVTLRGRAMQDAADSPDARAGGGGTMLALIGSTDEQAHDICVKCRQNQVLVCANFNAPGQVVLSGHREACERAATLANEMGLRSSMLAVAGAFHSPLMAQAASRLGEALERTTFHAPRCRVIANVTAEPHPAAPAEIKRLLVDQLTSPVRWAQSCSYLAAHAVSGGQADYIEVAPGKTLMGLMRRIDKNIKVTSNDTP
jgi:[acyl-carrier-protein] S-malonyltransferase